MPDSWVEPLGVLRGRDAAAAMAADLALPLAGGPAAFTMVRLIGPDAPPAPVPLADVPEEWQDKVLGLVRRPASFAGLPVGRPLVMGILNVTPDSFSDGGQYFDAGAAVAAGHAMLEAGADLLDIGGESTRPGAEPVAPEEEQARILPVVRELAKAGCISVDTRHAATMRAAIEAGAEIINDISALRHDPDAARVVAEAEVGVILMHMLGDDPRTVQQDIHYRDVVMDVVLDVAEFLASRVAWAEARGIPRERIAIDPGIGFGKRGPQNLELIQRLPILAGIGRAIVVGASRKRFISEIIGSDLMQQRIPGSVSVAIAAAHRGAAILRVHDVDKTVAALKVMAACEAGEMPAVDAEPAEE